MIQHLRTITIHIWKFSWMKSTLNESKQNFVTRARCERKKWSVRFVVREWKTRERTATQTQARFTKHLRAFHDFLTYFQCICFGGVDLHSSKSFKLIIPILDIAVTTSGEIESRTLNTHFLWKWFLSKLILILSF